MCEKEMVTQEELEGIRAIVERVKPRYTQYGGDIEFVGVKDCKVSIKPSGYCHR